MNLGDMRRDVADNLKLAGVDAPSDDRVTRVLNRCKTRLVSFLEILDEELFTTRADFVVTPDLTYIALPAGFVRLIGLDRVDGDTETPVTVLDAKQRGRRSARAADSCMPVPMLYPEGDKLWFVGRPPACTLRMRYRQIVADLASSAASSSYSAVPAEWHRTIVDLATAMLIPVNNEEHGKYFGEAERALADARDAVNRRMDTEPLCILDNILE